MDFLLFKMLARVGLIGFDPRMGFFPWGSAGGKTSYKVQRSVRLRAAASACFSRTPVNMAATTWTISAWVKRGTLGNNGTIFSACDGSSANTTWVGFNGDALAFALTDGTYYIQSSAVYRDPSAWYHVVAVLETSNATASDRMRLYVNGERITSFSTATYPTQNYTTFINTAVPHTVGSRYRNGVIDRYHDGEIAEVVFASSSALTPSSFGEQDAATRMWVPKKYTGSYGTNGFYLDFSDITSTTTLGYDKSGNNNHWTANNISLTAGITYDSMLDVPGLSWGDGGTGRGNYCTLNPLSVYAVNPPVLTNGNLQTLTTTGNYGTTLGTIGMASGKWYWEITPTAVAGGTAIGFANASADLSQFVGQNTNSWCYYGDGKKYTGGAATSYGATFTTNDVIGVALDMDAGTATFYKNGVSQGQAFSGLTGTLFPAVSDGSTGANSTFVANFGQRPFAYTPPSGHKALQLGNLPAPTGAAAKPWQHFDIVLGNGPNIKSTAEAVFPSSFFEWIKERFNPNNHQLIDIVRGSSAVLQSNTTAAETTYSAPSGLSVAWVWKAGGAPVTNTAGSITSQVSANVEAGFSIVTFTMPASGDFTVGHGLGVPPKLIIEKQRSDIGGWPVWANGFTKDEYIYLNQTAAKGTATNAWGAAVPNSSVFGMRAGTLAGSLNTQVAYCFAEVPGFSKIDSYVGNGSTDGPFVYCGFRPRYVLVKRTDAAGSWVVLDAAREKFNPEDYVLYANGQFPEMLFSNGGVDAVSNGFKLRSIDSLLNINGGSYIFYAIAEAPFQYANAR